MAFITSGTVLLKVNTDGKFPLAASFFLVLKGFLIYGRFVFEITVHMFIPIAPLDESIFEIFKLSHYF